ncbi:MAG TPA: DUF1573 domain-containing protein [Bacteroidetes bacterium]|nr:DUF1573 domain-containing protein [Bacteroidota bacterium]
MNFLNFKKTNILLCLSIFALSAFSACKEDKNSGNSIEEIQTEGKISSIIRSPITAQGLKDTVNVAKMVFKETVFDFGEVKEGDMVTHVFSFENTGKIPLVINDAHSTCGCTIPKWPKDPIPAGGKGVIKVEFNTKNKHNFQEKPVIITANTYPSVTKVFVKGLVKPQGS